MNTKLKFKKGDKVKLVSVGALGWEDNDWASRDGLIIGSEYKVVKSEFIDDSLPEEGQWVEISPKGPYNFSINSDHFELAKKRKS